MSDKQVLAEKATQLDQAGRFAEADELDTRLAQQQPNMWQQMGSEIAAPVRGLLDAGQAVGNAVGNAASWAGNEIGQGVKAVNNAASGLYQGGANKITGHPADYLPPAPTAGAVPGAAPAAPAGADAQAQQWYTANAITPAAFLQRVQAWRAGNGATKAQVLQHLQQSSVPAGVVSAVAAQIN
jgi:hypothetical protein